jgi:beta-mannanase
LRFGAYAPPSPESGIEPTDELQRRLGRPISIVNWYQDWGGADTAFNPVWVERVVASGRTPLLTWEPWKPGPAARQPAYTLARIAGGAYDDYIRGWARAIRSYGKTIYLRPMHEMNGYWYPWGGRVNGNSPARYVAAWRHIWEIFEQERAANVRWVWSPYVEDVPEKPGNALER